MSAVPPLATDKDHARNEQAIVDAEAALALVDTWCANGQAIEMSDRLAAARARLLLLSGPTVASLVKRCDEARQHCLDVSSQAIQQKTRQEHQQALSTITAQRSHDQVSHQDIFAERQARIRSLVERGHLEMALAQARRLVSDYPQEPSAERLFNEVVAQAHEQRRLSIADRNKEMQQEVNERIERELIPSCWDGQPVYPVDWLDRSASRDRLLTHDVAMADWEEKIRARLADRFSIDYQQMLPSEVLQDFARRSQLNIFIDPAIYAVDKPMPSIQAKNITGESALSWICRAAGVPWTIARGAICVGVDMDPTPVTGYFDVSELMFGGVDQPGRPLGFEGLNNGGGGGAGGGAGSLFAPAAAAASAAPTALTTEAIVDLIKKSISPTTWTRPGCGIEVRGSTLLVTAPTHIHALLRQFIQARSRLQTKLVYLDMKWMEISDGYLEEIGVDWQSGSAQTNPIYAATTSPVVSATTGHPGFYHQGGHHDISASESSIGAMPSSLSTMANQNGSTAGTGLSLSSALLKTFQLNAVAQAVERTGKGTVLSAPSMMTLNNVRSNCTFSTQTAYISGYDINGTGTTTISAGGGIVNSGPSFDPRISVISTGAALDIKPLVSADDKYVVLDVTPQWTDLNMFVDSFIAQRNGAPQIYDIELPMVRLREAKTTVQVPHGGSVLIGGFGYALDQATSTKVPFIGHIPFLGRLFGSRGRYSDRRKLYLLITATIHNYQELEAKQ